jgi:hypothetical protein
MSRMCAWCAQSFTPKPDLPVYCSDTCIDAAIELQSARQEIDRLKERLEDILSQCLISDRELMARLQEQGWKLTRG